jgi:hypothetical protein
MGSLKVSVVHKLTGEIVAVSQTTASVEGRTLEGIAIAGPDESVITTEIDEDDIAKLYRTHLVVGQELRVRDSSTGE